MKRVTSLLLAAVLLFSMAGCSTQNAAPAPLAPETAVPVTTEPAVPGAFLVGPWLNLGDGWTGVEFMENGQCRITEGESERSVPYFFAGDSVTVQDEKEVTLRVTEEEGITHLRRDALDIDLVEEGYYESFQPQRVEITMDNWQEYFETEYITHYQVEGATQKIKYRAFGCGFMLKEEYMDRLPTESGSINVDVTIQYDTVPYRVLNPYSFEYVFTDEINKAQDPKVDAIDKATVVDRRDPRFGIPEHSDLYGRVGAFLGIEAGYEASFNVFYYQIMQDYEVIGVKGYLYLLP